MIDNIRQSLWTQFGASIDMLKNAIILWPEEYWNTRKKGFYISYHVLLFLDYYLTIPARDLSSPLPFIMVDPEDLTTDEIDDLRPARIYTRTELLSYLRTCRDKCHQLIADLTEEKLNERWIDKSGDMNYSVLEILLYNMRHVQHHAAQLNLLLRQQINNAPDWVSRAGDNE
jgi:DinB family protein